MKINEIANKAFTELMIQKIEAISADWKKPWVTNSFSGIPQNINGGTYNGINSLALYLLCEKEKYPLPVFMTWKQANDLGFRINKGAKAFPVVFWNKLVIHKETDKKIDYNDYIALSDEDKKNYKVIPYMKPFNVFNVEQTNIKEQAPELYNKLMNKFYLNGSKSKDEKGLFSYPVIDTMIKDNLWFVPILPKEQDRAYYSSSEEKIVVPLKRQFKDGESFYATLFHEMAHSTGHKSRLDRLKPAIFGSYDYGREELVAELSAAIVSSSLGISSTIREENAAYLKSWLQTIKEKPDFLFSVLGDVNKASQMILDKTSSIEAMIGKEKDVVSIIEANLKENIGEVVIKVNEQNENDINLSVYDNSMIYLGDIFGMKTGEKSWKFSTDTSIVIMVPQNKLDFFNKRLHGSIISDEKLELRELLGKKRLSVLGTVKVKIDKIQVMTDKDNKPLIRCNINGNPQMSEKIPTKLYEEYLSGKRDLKSIAAEVFKNEIDLLNNRDNQIKR